MGKIIWVFSSKQPLDTLYKKHHHEGSPFENQLQIRWLGLLSTDACQALIKKGNFSPKQQIFLKKWAGEHPFYLQLLAERLWLKKQTSETKSTVLDGFKMASQRHLNDLWDSLSTKEQALLLNYVNNPQPINHLALRCMGIITQEGRPFSKVFCDYLQEKTNE